MSKKFANKSEYPLQWPDHISRTKNPEKSQFKVTLFQAMENVRDELRRLAKDSDRKVEDILFSSNVTLGNKRPDDPGVCVYFTWDGMELCIPVDRYNKVRCNVQAIYHCIKADRTKVRHGGVDFVMAEKRGESYLRLPERSDWPKVLELDKPKDQVTMQEVKKARNRLAKQHHSDAGGSDETMKKINKAFEDAKAEVGG